ncbi:MAG: hypothetical protein Q8O37_11405 [Sulfuricellaceae bacterium]|nr:hypothetical protein [Sulfuricellaceae bacterium]
MEHHKHGRRFWIGNAILALALATLFFMDELSTHLGVWAMVLWMVMVGVGVSILTSDKGGPNGMPD